MFNINNVTQSEYHAADKAPKTAEVPLMEAITTNLIAIGMTLKIFFLRLMAVIFGAKLEDISGDLVLVTGGGNGLGRALSMRFAQEKCDVAIADIDFENALKTADEIRRKFKVKCKAFRCDISNYDEILKLKSDIESEMRPVDVLVNNAGLLYMSEFVSSDPNDIQRVIDVNLTSQIRMTLAFLPPMIARRKGRVVTIASMASFTTLPMVAIYTATKFGLNGFMKNLRDELLCDNGEEFVHITTVFPEFINTRQEMVDVLDTVEYKFRRLSPEEVAEETVTGVRMNKGKIVICNSKLVFHIGS